MSWLNTLALYLAYPFVQRAIIVGVLVALCSSLLGVTLVLKRYSFIGDGLAHVAFGAMAVASVLRLTNNMALVLPVTVVCAVLLLRGGERMRVAGDAAIAMVSVGALAMGYLLMNVFPTSSNVSGDVCGTLFGSQSILTVTLGEMWLAIVLSLAVIAVFVLLYHKIFAVTFDETFARSSGQQAETINLAIAITIAVIVSISMSLVGSLLVSALVVFPALSAMRLCQSFRSVTVCAAVLSVACALVGLFASILASTPVGATIVLADMLAYGACCGVGALRGR